MKLLCRVQQEANRGRQEEREGIKDRGRGAHRWNWRESRGERFMQHARNSSLEIEYAKVLTPGRIIDKRIYRVNKRVIA